MKKLAITGASHFVNRMFEACENYQWAREFLKNALEAGATKVEFGIDWQSRRKARRDAKVQQNLFLILLFDPHAVGCAS